MTNEDLHEAALQELQRIEKGTSTIELIGGDILLGDVQYRTSNGWTFVVFSDGAAWDYIHSITVPSGEQLKIWPGTGEHECAALGQLQDYHPPGEQSKTIWGFLP
jgi:hypothetical protein